MGEMNEQRAREILGERIVDDRLAAGTGPTGAWIRWYVADKTIELDGDFSADELEAMAWWMRNKASA